MQVEGSDTADRGTEVAGGLADGAAESDNRLWRHWPSEEEHAGGRSKPGPRREHLADLGVAVSVEHEPESAARVVLEHEHNRALEVRITHQRARH